MAQRVLKPSVNRNEFKRKTKGPRLNPKAISVLIPWHWGLNTSNNTQVGQKNQSRDWGPISDATNQQHQPLTLPLLHLYNQLQVYPSSMETNQEKSTKASNISLFEGDNFKKKKQQKSSVSKDTDISFRGPSEYI